MVTKWNGAYFSHCKRCLSSDSSSLLFIHLQRIHHVESKWCTSGRHLHEIEAHVGACDHHNENSQRVTVVLEIELEEDDPRRNCRGQLEKRETGVQLVVGDLLAQLERYRQDETDDDDKRQVKIEHVHPGGVRIDKPRVDHHCGDFCGVKAVPDPHSKQEKSRDLLPGVEFLCDDERNVHAGTKLSKSMAHNCCLFNFYSLGIKKWYPQRSPTLYKYICRLDKKHHSGLWLKQKTRKLDSLLSLKL